MKIKYQLEETSYGWKVHRYFHISRNDTWMYSYTVRGTYYTKWGAKRAANKDYKKTSGDNIEWYYPESDYQ